MLVKKCPDETNYTVGAICDRQWATVSVPSGHALSHFQHQNHLVWRELRGLRPADVLVCAYKNDKKKNSQGSRCLQRLRLRGSH